MSVAGEILLMWTSAVVVVVVVVVSVAAFVWIVVAGAGAGLQASGCRPGDCGVRRRWSGRGRTALRVLLSRCNRTTREPKQGRKGALSGYVGGCKRYLAEE